MATTLRPLSVAFALLTLPTVVAAATPPAAPASYTRAGLQQLYVDYLRAEGYVPAIDKDGDVSFRFEGGNYYIEVNEQDLEFFRIVYPRFWSTESTEERRRALAAIDHANSATKNTKVFTVPDNVTATAEVFLANPEDFRRVFGRCTAALSYGADQFRTKMRQLAAAPPAAPTGQLTTAGSTRVAPN